MNLSNEIKLGAFLITVLLLFVLGLNFLKGNSLFSKDQQFFTYYDNAQGLLSAADVQLNGVSIGKVKEIELQADKKIKVNFNINSKVNIPEGSIAKMISSDIISGTKMITVILGDETGNYMNKGFMEGEENEGLLDDLSSSVSPLLGTVQSALTSIDSVMIAVNNLLNEATINHLNNSFETLDATMKDVQDFVKVLNKQSQSLSTTMDNIASISGNLEQNNAAITGTINNLESFSQQLGEADFSKTLLALESASEDLNELMNTINSDQGTLGKLIHEDGIYNNLNQTLESIDGLLQEVKSHPGKHINFSVFPAKNK